MTNEQDDKAHAFAEWCQRNGGSPRNESDVMSEGYDMTCRLPGSERKVVEYKTASDFVAFKEEKGISEPDSIEFNEKTMEVTKDGKTYRASQKWWPL